MSGLFNFYLNHFEGFSTQTVVLKPDINEHETQWSKVFGGTEDCHNKQSFIFKDLNSYAEDILKEEYIILHVIASYEAILTLGFVSRHLNIALYLAMTSWF
ncbi:hypothetical protein [Pedobacter aquatilis]|uniref:hypothetical protein n=1 Tax=Pedobacter aquatilis TaxID=351343 RepID=UPI00292D36E5|nr:hypothetical protein [Pedobacter aquatilis]